MWQQASARKLSWVSWRRSVRKEPGDGGCAAGRAGCCRRLRGDGACCRDGLCRPGWGPFASPCSLARGWSRRSRAPSRSPGRVQLGQHLALLDHLEPPRSTTKSRDHIYAGRPLVDPLFPGEVVEDGVSAIRLNTVVRPLPKVGLVSGWRCVRSSLGEARSRCVHGVDVVLPAGSLKGCVRPGWP